MTDGVKSEKRRKEKPTNIAHICNEMIFPWNCLFKSITNQTNTNKKNTQNTQTNKLNSNKKEDQNFNP